MSYLKFNCIIQVIMKSSHEEKKFNRHIYLSDFQARKLIRFKVNHKPKKIKLKDNFM